VRQIEHRALQELRKRVLSSADSEVDAAADV
jgi:hypothetical protein